MRISFKHLGALGVAAALAVTTLSACSSDSDEACDTASSMKLVAAEFAAPAPQPPRPRTQTQAPRPKPTYTRPATPPTRTTTRPTTPTKPPTAPTTRATTPKAPTKTLAPLKVTPIKPGKIKRQLKGETAYYPVPMVMQTEGNIVAAQDAVRAQIEPPDGRRFTKSTRHFSPVTKRTYIYHSDDDYKSGVQDLYDPFDPRNWVEPFSPFYLATFQVEGFQMTLDNNPLNGDYADDEGLEGNTSTNDVAPYTPPNVTEPGC